MRVRVRVRMITRRSGNLYYGDMHHNAGSDSINMTGTMPRLAHVLPYATFTHVPTIFRNLTMNAYNRSRKDGG
ncbi:uncharacterized protein H6S33_000279 [Morchella sextelata]|uniref:uncharacterized protein n=1 Tax=Morchella sextelata TaxID=1174677 RepID=UPI001D054CAD|nr:uncharacterized protein H6S33_000279 [Morchella sextelata]KAH0614643.1 hypothetical protein H6S33_000279 [Morchella sextelata]